MNGAEKLAAKKAHEKKLDMAEITMLTWMSGCYKDEQNKD